MGRKYQIRDLGPEGKANPDPGMMDAVSEVGPGLARELLAAARGMASKGFVPKDREPEFVAHTLAMAAGMALGDALVRGIDQRHESDGDREEACSLVFELALNGIFVLSENIRIFGVSAGPMSGVMFGIQLEARRRLDELRGAETPAPDMPEAMKGGKRG